MWPARQGAAPTPVAEPKGMEVCQACHQKGFVGGMPAPRLVGQSYEYLLAAMNRFADGTRTNSQDMATLMKAMSPAERDAMAKYIAGL